MVILEILVLSKHQLEKFHTCMFGNSITCSVSSDIDMFLSSLSKSMAPSCRRKTSLHDHSECVKFHTHLLHPSMSTAVQTVRAAVCVVVCRIWKERWVLFAVEKAAAARNLEHYQLPTHQAPAVHATLTQMKT